MLENEARNCSFVVVGNIPGVLRSSDLRAFFSHLVEKGGFVCFHYRHRPEHVAPRPALESTAQSGNSGSTTREGPEEREGDAELMASKPSSAGDEGAKAAGTRCCVAAVDKRLEEEFLSRYRGRHWARSGGELLRRKVKISRLSVLYQETNTPSSDRQIDPTDNLLASVISSQGGIPWSDLCNLPELNPPSVMPHGNIGTPTSIFMDLIQQCKLPGRIIKKLNLEFPKTRSKRRYGAVCLDYGGQVRKGGGEGEGEEREECERRRDKESSYNDEEEDDDDVIPSDDDHDAEEWERYEALHDDVDKQARTKERLFEEDMEVVWEKGGSGLVFYTDSSYWHNLEGEFDEQCSKEDDWDVDTSLYYDHEGGDKGARDLRDIRQEGSIRDGAHQASVFAGFEKYTKGIGSKVLKQSGWTEGMGIGQSSEGRAEPLDTEGQHPHNKTGLGYRGEKLIRHAPQTQKRPRRATRDVVISTVYDRREEEEDTVLRSAPSRTIKYREGVKFVAGETLNDPHQKAVNNTSTD